MFESLRYFEPLSTCFALLPGCCGAERGQEVTHSGEQRSQGGPKSILTGSNPTMGSGPPLWKDQQGPKHTPKHPSSQNTLLRPFPAHTHTITHAHAPFVHRKVEETLRNQIWVAEDFSRMI